MLGTLGDVSCRTLAALTAEPRGARHAPERADSDVSLSVIRTMSYVSCVYRVRCGQLGRVECAKYEKTTRAVVDGGIQRDGRNARFARYNVQCSPGAMNRAAHGSLPQDPSHGMLN